MNAQRLSMREKLGYALGDAAANLVWRGAMFFLAVFYTDVFGLSASSVALLLLLVRMSDGVTDIIMGMIADRTQSRFGKFRPWILVSTPLLGVFMVMTYSTPNLSPGAKLAYAYFSYIGLTLAYTMNNVPYSALMGVMTSDVIERASLASWRFAGAFFGGFIVAVGTPLLLDAFRDGSGNAYQSTMFIFAVLLITLLLITFFSTRERVKSPPTDTTRGQSSWLTFSINMLLAAVPLMAITLFFYYRNWPSAIFFIVSMTGATLFIKRLLNQPRAKLNETQLDIVNLLTNKPWLLLLAVGFLFMMFTGIKAGATAYYFTHYLDLGELQGTASMPSWLRNLNPKNALLSAYLGATMLVSVLGALTMGALIKRIGKRELFIATLILGGGLSCPVYFLGPNDVGTVFGLGVASEFFIAMWPALFFSMLGDSADYSEWKNQRRATGLFFSAGTFINKTGGGFAGALIVMVLASYGYVGTDESSIAYALPAIRSLVSWIPATFALAAAAALYFYPLSQIKMLQIQTDLDARRQT